jgi:hypothetical protein
VAAQVSTGCNRFLRLIFTELIRYVGNGELLERLTRHGNEGRQWFFFARRALGSEWFREQVTLAERLAEARYTPEHRVTLPLARVADACALPQESLRQGVQRSRDLQAAVVTLLSEMTRWYDSYPAPDSSPDHQAAVAVGARVDARVAGRRPHLGPRPVRCIRNVRFPRRAEFCCGGGHAGAAW